MEQRGTPEHDRHKYINELLRKAIKTQVLQTINIISGPKI
jgi:hypothetical protein